MLSKRKDIEMSEVNNGQVKIQIQKGLGITHALKKLVEEQQMELSGGKITASEWNSVMYKLAEIQANRKANGQASIFNGGTYKTKSGWQNSFVVHPNQEIEFNAEEISAIYEAMGAKFSSKALVSSTPTPPSAVDENIPKKDESKVKEVWEETRKVIKNGIRLQQKISQEITSGMVHRYQVVQVQE